MLQVLSYGIHKNKMKLVYILIVCALSFAALASAQLPKFNFNENKRNLPEISGFGGGSRKQGFDVNLDARQKVWESRNGRHSVDVTGGYSQHLGGPYGNSPADRRVGAGYTYRF